MYITEPSFPDDINYDYLQETAIEMECARIASKGNISLDWAKELESIGSQAQPIVDNPLASDTPNRILYVWSALNSKNRYDKDRWLAGSDMRYKYMLSNLAAWEWLDEVAASRCRDVLMGKEQGDCWFDGIVRQIEGYVYSGEGPCDILARDFNPNLNVSPYKYLANRRAPLAAFREEVITFVVDTSVDVLSCWLGYNCSGLPRAQAWFTRLIIDTFGQHALLLDKVYTAHQFLKARVIGNRRVKDKQLKRRMLDRVAERLKMHPLSDRNSVERALVHRRITKSRVRTPFPTT